jgi:hypothetical protein
MSARPPALERRPEIIGTRGDRRSEPPRRASARYDGPGDIRVRGAARRRAPCEQAHSFYNSIGYASRSAMQVDGLCKSMGYVGYDVSATSHLMRKTPSVKQALGEPQLEAACRRLRQETSMLRIFPLLAIPVIVYALFAFPAGAEGMRSGLAAEAFAVPLASGAPCVVSRGQLLTIFAVICLFFEVLKSTRPTSAAMIDNSLAVAVFVIALILFLLAPGFGTTEFFLILLMCVLDFMAGFVVMITTSRRTVDYAK